VRVTCTHGHQPAAPLVAHLAVDQLLLTAAQRGGCCGVQLTGAQAGRAAPLRQPASALGCGRGAGALLGLGQLGCARQAGCGGRLSLQLLADALQRGGAAITECKGCGGGGVHGGGCRGERRKSCSHGCCSACAPPPGEGVESALEGAELEGQHALGDRHHAADGAVLWRGRGQRRGVG